MGPRNADAMHKTQGNLVPRRQDVFWIPTPLSSFHRNEQGPTDTVSRLSIIHTREAFHKNVCESRRCHQDTKEIKNINFSLWVSGFSQKESSGQAIHTAEMNAVEKGGKKKKSNLISVGPNVFCVCYGGNPSHPSPKYSLLISLSITSQKLITA